MQTNLPPGTLLLDYIRYHRHLTGTKIGCREGDCGACTLLIADADGLGNLKWESATSCLTALGNVHGKQVVTVEGLNMDKLNLVQEAMANESASQCGFCTPGFVVSMSGYCFQPQPAHPESAKAAISGNICRCTGYKSIEKAANRVCSQLEKRSPSEDALHFLVENQHFPAWLLGISERLKSLQTRIQEKPRSSQGPARNLGGGTDLYVQQHEAMVHAEIRFLRAESDLRFVRQSTNWIEFGGASTVSDLFSFAPFRTCVPDWKEIEALVSSLPIRNIATIAGNFVNASPIGDLSILFLALDAHLTLQHENEIREIPLRDFFLGYKQLAKRPEEIAARVRFQMPDPSDFISFEKVCKRKYLDIASVNSALFLQMDGVWIRKAGASAGGVGPVPLFLKNASTFLEGKEISEELVKAFILKMHSEISPISDVRGTADYKRLLLSQQIKGHFLRHFPQLQAQLLVQA
jgi:xanthine dehydrogenase small subunit